MNFTACHALKLKDKYKNYNNSNNMIWIKGNDKDEDADLMPTSSWGQGHNLSEKKWWDLKNNKLKQLGLRP